MVADVILMNVMEQEMHQLLQQQQVLHTNVKDVVKRIEKDLLDVDENEGLRLDLYLDLEDMMMMMDYYRTNVVDVVDVVHAVGAVYVDIEAVMVVIPIPLYVV